MRKFGLWGLIASLMAFGTVPTQANTYMFDFSVDDAFSSALPFGTINVTSTGTVEVSLPDSYSMTQFALNLVDGTVDSGDYTVNTAQAATYGPYGPFNTVLSGSFGNHLTFTISDFAGLFSHQVNGFPIWFAANVSDGTTFGTIVSDVVLPLPAALPLFVAGLGLMGVVARRRKQKAAAAHAAA